ncbi:MAG: ABC-F family ATP-binding cassette domain-containing protein [Anaerolineae bacterium]
MSVLVAQGLSKSFGALDVFAAVDCRVEHGDRIGLVGPNGEGKTTLLRMLAGLESLSAGQVAFKRGLRIGYLPQDPPLAGALSLWDDAIQVFAELRSQQAQLAALEGALAATQDGEEHDRLLASYGELQLAFDVGGGYTYELRTQQVLTGLGFSAEEYDKPLAVLSGGQRTRALLARLILEQPDLLLLDEPTNHLDLDAVEWLEQTLLEWPGSLVVVAHDRYFLDKVVTRIWEMALGRLDAYRGNYSQFVQQRADRLAARRKEWEAQQEFIAETEAFIRRYKAGQRSKEARGRLTRLDRFKRDELIERPLELKTMSLGLTTDVRSGDIVLRTKNLVVGYVDTPSGGNGTDARHGDALRAGQATPAAWRREHLLVSVPDLEIRRGQCVALIGPNGSGKTTLVKTILEQVKPLRGSARLGASVITGYLAQASAGLNPNQTVLAAILEVENLPLAQARNFLGRFLFSGDDVFKPISVLSGGQRSRVALARLTLQGANFLLLDEPTNHLDVASQEILQDVLDRFPGTVLLVSHDRYLVDALADEVWALRAGELFIYKGGYQGYLRQREIEKAEAAGQRREETPADTTQDRERMKEERRQRKAAAARAAQATDLEAQIHAREADLAEVERRLDQASSAADVQRITDLAAEHQAVQVDIESLMAAWAELV